MSTSMPFSVPAAATLIAATRFGLGPRPGELAAIAPDPKGWVLRQLRGGGPAAMPPVAGLSGQGALPLPDSAAMVASMLEARRDRKLGQGDAAAEAKDDIRAVYRAEVAARTVAAINADAPLIERLVQFWSNHFTVSCLRPVVHGFCGAFEREAIRQHVLGRFSDMLLAVVRHPAMLFYLDNVASVGPDSPFGQRTGKGLNENLGREILELHTLGVDGGYAQADVEALARILTGWTVARLKDPAPGGFRFEPRIHEPGPKSLLGRTYASGGLAEGEAALLDLARHPATARYVATKLARHFIADDPPSAAVERIAQRFTATGGDLRQVTIAVVEEEEIWKRPFAKVRTPTELVIASCRAAGLANPPAEGLVNSLRVLDQPAFFAPSPAGWPDTAAAWVSPEAMIRRAEWCQVFAQRLADPPDPLAVAAASFGDALLPEETAQAVRRAPDRRIGLALLLASPEFQRR